jgi:hypothetical protein
MPKITENRMKEIIEDIMLSNDQISMRQSTGAYLAESIANHPEIKSLFECDADLGKYISATECPTCARTSERFELTNYPDTWMCDGCALTRGSIVGKWNSILENLICATETCEESTEPHAPVAEGVADAPAKAYEVIQCEPTGALKTMGCQYDESMCPTMVNSELCRTHCKTNGLQNFAGHEVEGRSIRCAHRFNVGGEG